MCWRTLSPVCRHAFEEIGITIGDCKQRKSVCDFGDTPKATGSEERIALDVDHYDSELEKWNILRLTESMLNYRNPERDTIDRQFK
jgi:hypothetical protein